MSEADDDAARPSQPGGGEAPAASPVPLERSAVDGSLVEAFDRQVAAHPDLEAVRAEGRSLTYRELADRSSRLAAALVPEIERGTPVAFLTPHDEHAAVALLGILRAGGAAIPLDPLQPAEAQQAILTQSTSPLLVTCAASSAAAEATGARLLVLDDLPEADAPAFPDLGPDDLAVILYTSGSTGEPKGVCSRNRSETQTMWTMDDLMAFGPGDRVGIVMPVSYRFALAFTTCALLTGATACFYDLRRAGFPGLPPWVAEEGITILPLVPTIQRGLASGPATRPFPTVRWVMLSGERADVSDVEDARRIYGVDVQVAHTLASTEAQIVAWDVLGPDAPLSAPLSVGTGAPDKELAVVDADDHPVPVGEVGEITVTSAYLTEGYWQRDDLTDLVFTPPGADGRRTFRTGDLGWVDERGRFTVVGRGDGLVKVRGHRVELAEVEAALIELDAVASAVVVQQDDDRGSLAAHVVLAEGHGHTTTAALRDALETTLPSFKVPSVIVLLPALPTLPNGKVDRRALPVVDLRAGRARALPDDEPSPPDELEKELIRIWEAVIELSPITVDDDFFAISDSSLDAASLVVAIEEKLDVELPVSVLLRASTVRQLATEIRAHEAREDAAARGGLVRLSEVNDAPRLLLCPDLSGSPFRFHPLVEALGTDVQVLGFESPLFSGPGRDVRTIEGLAAHNVAVATDADPDGPYHLAGWSVGGFVAFEMARQLRAAGRPVGAVVVVDAGPRLVSHTYPPLSRKRRRSRRTPRPTPPESDSSRDGALLRALASVLPQDAVDELVWRSDLRRHGQVRADRRLPFVWRSNWRATRAYRFKPYDGDVDFITSRPDGDPDPTSGIDDFVGGELRIHHVEGEHELLVFDPLVDGVAGAVLDALRSAT